MKIPNETESECLAGLSLARIVSEDSQQLPPREREPPKSSKDS